MQNAKKYTINYRVSQKTHFQNAAGATVHRLNHHLPAPLVSGDCFFGHFLIRLSRIKRPQIMSMIKFSPIALNFGYDFVLSIHFLGHPVDENIISPDYVLCYISRVWDIV